MNNLSPTEITTAQQLLANYAPAQETLTILATNNGDLADCLNKLSKSPTFNDPTTKKSLWENTIKVLRQELCSDEGWRGKVKEYSNAPTSAVAFTGMIVHLISVSHLQLDPGIATCIALYVSKVGLNIFCEHITPEDQSK
jgi:hypothetical protein